MSGGMHPIFPTLPAADNGLPMTDRKSRLLPGALLLLAGAALVVLNHRVLATFLLELVVQTITADSTTAMEPYNFSWGTMHWGCIPNKISALCAGLFLLAIGQFLVFPGAIPRLKATVTTPGSGLPHFALVGASLLALVAAAAYLLIPYTTMQTVGVVATMGAADPVSLAESLPVRSSQVFMVALVGSQLLLLVAAFTAPAPGAVTPMPGGRAMSIASCIGLFLFAVLLTFVCLGPVRFLYNAVQTGNAADPTMLAGKISLAIRVMLLASPVLFVSAVLMLVAVLVSPRSRS